MKKKSLFALVCAMTILLLLAGTAFASSYTHSENFDGYTASAYGSEVDSTPSATARTQYGVTTDLYASVTLVCTVNGNDVNYGPKSASGSVTRSVSATVTGYGDVHRVFTVSTVYHGSNTWTRHVTYDSYSGWGWY